MGGLLLTTGFVTATPNTAAVNTARSLQVLRQCLFPSHSYSQRHRSYYLLGEVLLFLGETEYAVKAFWMNCAWTLHEGAPEYRSQSFCDECGTASAAITFKCMTCSQIDLCEACFELYQQRKCFGPWTTDCSCHDFFKVPQAPVECVKAACQEQNAEELEKWELLAMPPESAKVWRDELREKYGYDCTESGPSSAGGPCPLEESHTWSARLSSFLKPSALFTPLLHFSVIGEKENTGEEEAMASERVRERVSRLFKDDDVVEAEDFFESTLFL